ncbi:centrosomal protein of 290 kDa isoform X5 [Ornithorhynchus anatinus]|uniref:centrosomal protein of 290 kDa isoform X5 n=1 Tax=Ornithorhynchus anatinus TaxID=9258 RepID=UPI000454210A|nr:centrosomal protein of 290 kDa isoform X5 [Ornithorhynchus anatinus]
MPPLLDWKKIMRVDPDSLPRQDELADHLLESLSKVEGKDLKDENHENVVHLFRITQALMKMKAQEVELALEEVEKAGVEQAKFENQLKTRVMKLENELEMAQQATGGRDTRFLREEIRQLEKQLEQKDRELADLEKEMEKEKKVNEQFALRNEEAENENSKLRRENEQLRQDIIDYQRQIDSQKETLLSRRGEDSDYRSQLSKKNLELVQYLDEIQSLTEANEKIEVQNQEMRKNLEESVQEMEKMTDEYSKMKVIVQQTDTLMDQLRKEKDHYRLQVQELTELLKAKNEEDDPVMLAVNAKVEEWKRILTSKDDEIMEYQQMLQNLREKLKNVQLDGDKNNVMALQQGLQERDGQIKMLTEQVEQYTKEMEKNTLIIEHLKSELQKNKGVETLSQQNRIMEIQTKLQLLEQKTKEAERIAELAEADAKDKDIELIETLKRLKEYETGIYGLEDAVAEIKNLKTQIKVRDHEIELLTQEMNKLGLKINDFLDENEELRERVGLDPKTMIDLTEFRSTKNLKQQQYRAENQILLKEIESLEEERLELKQKIRKMAQEKGKRDATLGITDELHMSGPCTQELRMMERNFDLTDSANVEEPKLRNELIFKDLLIKEAQNKSAELELERHRSQAEQNEYLAKELNEKDKDLERNKMIISKFQNKLKRLTEENKQLEDGMKEILQAIKEMQQDPSVKGGETSLIIPSLERLVNAVESKNAEGIFDANLHLKAQVDQLTGRNEELRQELKESRKEATSFSHQLAKANLKIEHLEKETSLLRQSGGSNVVFKVVDLPEGMAPSSTSIINSQNEYLIHLLQELEDKDKTLNELEDAIEDYKRKFAVIRHQQGLLYKEYQSEREIWQTESEKMKEEKRKFEDQTQQDAIKVKEYNNLLDALQMNTDEMKKQLAEHSRKMTVLQVNEKTLSRQYSTLVEMEQHLRKENEKQKNEVIAMEVAVSEKIGCLQRFKETAVFKIAALQKLIDNSVPLSELELANKQYNELTAKYRDMLQKDNVLVQRTSNLEHLECENASLKEQMDCISKELEITKEKLHTVEQAWEQVTKLGNEPILDKASKAITNSEIVSISKKITMLEMKELNERQRAEHSQKMYEQVRTSLKQVEERNFELETKFAEVTKINLDAQKIEQTLRDELANSVTKALSDVDRQRIIELEKSEMELKVEVSKLREISDIAKMQVEVMNTRQQSREKEVESLRMQVLDYQAQSDEKALIAKLHQHIVALQISEATAVGKLESITSKFQKMEAYNLRLEQKLDDKEQALYYARLEGRNRAKHLRQTIQALRRQFSGALPLAQQEKFSKTMVQLQDDKLKILQEVEHSKQERRTMENKTLEVELKLKGLEELIATLKDTRGAQKVIDWHMKMEELRLQELKLSRELVKGKEEMKYLNNIISEYEHTISSLEEEIVQQNKFHEEQQVAWDQREVELERQLDVFERQQNEILNAARKFEEATGSIPDSTLPLPNQLEIALRKIKEHVRIILETRATCKSLEEKLKDKEDALWKAEQNILSRDSVINELRLRLPATVERERLIAELGKKEEEPEYHHTVKVAQQTIANIQARLNHKEEVLKKYQHLLERARQEQEEIIKKHEEELRVLHQKLDLQTDNSRNRYRQTALELMKQSSEPVPTNKDFIRLVEMEQTVAEQDTSLSSLLNRLKEMSHDLVKQKHITSEKVREFEILKSQLEEKHAAEAKKLKAEAEELKYLLSQTEKELQSLKCEIEAQKEANTRAPTTTLKNLVERLKSQLSLKEKQQKALSKALLELRAEMMANAEQQIISAASQKEANLNVQQMIDRQTKDLKAHVEDLNENLSKFKEALKISKNKETSLGDELNELNSEFQKKQKAFSKILREKEEMNKENEDLKKQIKRLTHGLQTKLDVENKLSLVDELQKKIKKLESELERKTEGEIRAMKEKSSKEEVIRWEEGKKWQTKMDGLRTKLKEKEKEADTLAKQLNTLKELFAKTDREKVALQKKLKISGVTVDHVVGVRALDSEKEVEELRKRNMELENEISHIRTKQALPRDSVVEDLHLKNRYLQEKLHALEKQFSKDTFSRPSISGVGSDDQCQREQELQKENLKLSSENIELRFQIEQANKDLPRLKNQVSDLKEMCELLKREKAEVERKMGHVRGAGRSGKTIPELEKTIGLMKKVVEKVQRENENLKRAPEVVSNEKLANLELENEKLKAEVEKLKLNLEGQLSMQYESKIKGTEKIVAENDRLRKQLKKETESAEKLRIAKNNLVILNEKLTIQLEETSKRLQFAESRGALLEGADSKGWKSIVITRMYETKMKEMETDIANKNLKITDLKQQLREATERERKITECTQDLKEQIELLKQFPEDAKTDQGLHRELQLLRLTGNRLEKEKAELLRQIEVYRHRTTPTAPEGSPPGYGKLMEEVEELKTQLETSNLEKQHFQEEIIQLKKELENVDPSFFEEIEDLKYNYNEEVKKNILLEERLKKLSEQFGVPTDSPDNASIT